VGVVLAALAMSVGWGVRGDYGHEAGAMIPGALLGLAVCLASGREDWWRRTGVMGLCGALGWALGGQMSYGRIVGYTAASSLPDVAYGYGSLFIVGGLWGGVGAGLLALSITQSRSYLAGFVRPLLLLGLVWVVIDFSGLTGWLVGRWGANDTDWVAAASALAVALVWTKLGPRDRPAGVLIAVLAAGWWAGYVVLTALGGLRMTPPRSDNWAGCVGLFVALLLYLVRQKNRAALVLAGWGFLFGGLGFVLGDFAQMLGRAQWGPIGHYPALQGLDYWKWMEQLFGLVMGLGVAIVFLEKVSPRLSPPPEDVEDTNPDTFALLFLLVIMMWLNLSKNARTWARQEHLPDRVLGLDPRLWLAGIGVLLTAGVVLVVLRHQRSGLPLMPSSSLGRAQLLFLLVLWVPIVGALLQASPRLGNRDEFLVHATFWITGGLCSLLVLSLRDTPRGHTGVHWAPQDPRWKLGPGYWVSLVLGLPLIALLAYLTVASHPHELPGSHLRF
jgi:hypothetical protein